MGKKKKPFIDKKHAQSFHLVHRSQRDPLQADEESSKHVLLPVGTDQQKKADDDPSGKKEEEVLEEHGIFFDDGYDYMQHLKPRTNLALEPLPDNVSVIETKPAPHQFGSVKLPAEVFASTREENEGLLNLAAPIKGPRPDWDPDIVAALDDALDLDDPDNILEDDFMLKANAVGVVMESGDEDEDEDDEEEDYFPSDEAEDEMGSDDGESYFMEEETKSRFTNYSMTSSVMRRNEGLKLVDERFEKLMEEYDEDEIGALDHEDLAGTINPDSVRLNALADEFLEAHQKESLSKVHEDQEMSKMADSEEDSDSEGSPVELVKLKEPPKEQWDCESILSTYSNLYNHPKVIKDSPKTKHIKLSSKTGIPVGVLPQRHSEKAKHEDKEENSKVGTFTATGPRTKDETKEEKKLRKQAVKSERKVRRQEKKANKVMFKVEEHRQEKARIHTHQQQGKKL